MLFKPGALVFDIGAHHGESADKFLNHYGAGKVISVEPLLENFLKARDWWKNEPRVKVFHAAVMRTAGICLIHKATEQDGLTTTQVATWSALYPGINFEEGEPCPVVTIPNLVDIFGEPDYIKVDVEGGEFSVIASIVEYTNGDDYAGVTRPVVAFEFHGAQADQAIECLNILLHYGWTHAEFVEEDIDLVNVPQRTIGEIIQQFETAPPKWGNITVR